MELRRRHAAGAAGLSAAPEPRVVLSESLLRRRRPLVLARPLRSAFQRLAKPKKVSTTEDQAAISSNSSASAHTLSGKRRRGSEEVAAPASGSHLKLQRFAPTQRLVDDWADFCLYLELDNASDAQTLEDAHAVVQVAASALRAAGCRVAVHRLQAPDSEVLAATKEDTQAFALSIGSEVPDQSVTERGAWAGRVAMQLAPWVTQHPDYTSHVLPLRGAAQCQRLCKLILAELRLELDVCCLHEDGHGELGKLTGVPVLLSAREKLLSQVMRADGLTNVVLYPLHRDEARRQLTRRWGAQSALALPPLEEIYAYFGPRIAMYFAWLAFYTRMLVLPSVYGVVVHVLGLLNLAPSYTVHCVLVAIGTSLIADMWRRRQREVEFAWGYDGVLSSVHATTRLQFRGEWMQDPVTGARCFDFPHHKRLLRQLLAVPLLVSMCCLVGGYVIGLHVLSERLRASYSESCRRAWAREEQVTTSAGYWAYVADKWVPSDDMMVCGLVSHGPSVMNAVIIYVMDNLYQLLARKLTEFENYRTLDEHEAHLVAKRMPFHLVNSNASLWFLAFYVRRLDRVRERLWILLVATQLIDNFKEVGLPLAVSVGGQVLTAENKRRRRQSLESLQSEDIEGSLRPRRKNSMPQLRAKQERERVDVAKAATEQRLARVLMQKRQATYRDTFADYKELMVQFGYVTLYSPVFPLAAAFAWLNNAIESRSDLLKLVNRHGYQRPIAMHARGIGVWEKVLVSFAGVAVVVNCALVWTYELDELLPAWTDLQRFAFIVGCEHVIFVIKAWLNWAAPEVPVTSSLGKKPVLPPAGHAIPAQTESHISLAAVHG
ncbi:hypothetical protein PHYSODRAFT_332774 [Phytophthora sojae]|uniref:Anoctamin transmembrane domain-containing protein n=1 Tax=Phytophthora sojae (strain P6497) TaxID=1094619 RepID=G4ZNH6_PHYSP|nr:hypothetical protein PHYSODRAFT_332774 [Phytophthora sojae]EGZ14384.1 hypothetical protein PHYSODRAFT_332774 [Phytophthora sojae]|eukprot:XP_009528133.1 hypothetical protein PHYSODRAFT_332774 [Phytophthora sojae]